MNEKLMAILTATGMDETMLAIKATVSAVVTALGVLLGWKGIMIAFWVLTMALDYLTGTYAAKRAGEWASSVARDGLWHKGGTIVVVMVAGIADIIISLIGQHLPLGFSWPGILLPLVVAWYIITEMGSILENAVKLGANVPEWLVRGLKISLKAVEEVAENTVDDIDTAEEIIHPTDAEDKEE